ncbi:MAG TPA: cyclic nucleotide-binding domain-containing protein [Conexibacter sp.]|nr:cyclic nucleotide-binding domain-containing protein [Conexibacter sp.]
MTDDRLVRKLRAQLETALTKRKDDDAIKLLLKLLEAEPKAPRWPHKLGELYQKRGKKRDAIEQYSNAAGLYADQGFIARAIAMAKTVFDIDPNRVDVLERVDPDAAARLHRKARPRALSASIRPPPPAEVVAPIPSPLPSRPAERPPPHPAVVLEDEPSAPNRHPAVLLEDDEPVPRRHPAVLDEDASLPAPPPPPRSRGALQGMPLDLPPAPRARVQPPPGLLDIELDLDDPLPPMPAPPRLPDLASSVLDLAEELTIAPDVAPHETRFSNAPPSNSLHVSLTDAELKPRKATDRRSLPPVPSPNTLAKLPLFPLFAEMPRDALVELVKASEVLEYEDGERVIRAGDPSDALFGIIEGSVEVAVPGQHLKLTLAEGDVFGESCLLAGEKRRADVTVRGRLSAIRISRQVFNQVIAMHPRIAEVLLDLLTRRLLSNLLQASPLFQELDAHGRQQMAQLFEVRRAARGTLLADIGKRTDGLYITLTGVLEVRYADGSVEQRDVGTLFGQSGLLMKATSDVSIRALANMLVLRLPAQAFHSVVMQYPGMLAHLSELTGTSVADVGI